MAEKEKISHLGTLEEDDEFEEFEIQDWKDSEEDIQVTNIVNI
jgi:26 proteasome complex subunit DSS1